MRRRQQHGDLEAGRMVRAPPPACMLPVPVQNQPPPPAYVASQMEDPSARVPVVSAAVTAQLRIANGR